MAKLFLGGGGLLIVARSAAVAVALWRRKVERRRHAETLATLQRLADWTPGLCAEFTPWNKEDATVFYQPIAAPALQALTFFPASRACAEPAPERQSYVVDGWGGRIHLRVPGPVHKRGWDLWSPGPNGVDEEGQGDDVVIGEDGSPR
ncbi:MAG: hypothetical protein ACAI25_04345 [Planctomycetota bacterium]